jgi:hypothetical protein
MPHAIIRGANGRRHEVDFGDAPVRVEIYASEETVEIFIEADFDTLPERWRFANIPATCLAKLPPQPRDVLRTPSCRHGGLIPKPTVFCSRTPSHDLLTAASRGVSVNPGC